MSESPLTQRLRTLSAAILLLSGPTLPATAQAGAAAPPESAGAAARPPRPAAGDLRSAITQGQPYGQWRPRYEWVDEQGLDQEAHAFTQRTRLGYRSANLSGFEGQLEFEDVRSLGSERFNSTTNGLGERPLVPDPESTEVNQAILAWTGLRDTRVQFGRQYIRLENERWLGPVNWRQNSVTKDAVALSYTGIPGLDLFYAWIDNVNRLFGEQHPALSDWDMDSHILHLAYHGLPHTRLVGYGYFMAFEDTASAGLSQRTLGLRADGRLPLGEGFSLLYTLELAQQDDIADGRPRDADYHWIGVGLRVHGLSLRVQQERLGGDGQAGLITPLATVHPHNGWADKFLASALAADGLVAGLVDTSVELGGRLFGIKLVAQYHDFRADHDRYDYGSEWDLLAVRPINPHLKLIAKFADYRAAANPRNQARNPVQSVDTRKFMLMADFSF